MTSLGSYLTKNGVGFAEFARTIGVEDSTVYRWANGDRAPSAYWAGVIERATSGRVPVSSWPKPSRALRASSSPPQTKNGRARDPKRKGLKRVRNRRAAA